MVSAIIIAATLFFALPLAAQSAAPLPANDRRVALVIGNSDYKNSPKLDNPGNDAADMAAALRQLGFQVFEGRDLDKPGMDRIIRDFAEALTGAHAGLFFYAGHGLQVGGQNYLVPIDAKLTSTAALDFEMVRLDLVHRSIEREANTNIIILDACRDNPLARNLARALGTRSSQIGRGLAAVESGEGTLISFSTQPGNVAFDGKGRNSPYTSALLKHIGAPGDDLSTILINVRNDVMKDTERRQVPWEHSALTSRFYFLAPPRKDASTDELKEIALWDTIRDGNNPALFEAYLKRYPTGQFAGLARGQLKQLQIAAASSAMPRAGDDQPVVTRDRVKEAQERLYELNYDPGPADGTVARMTEQAVREFEARSGLAPTGRLTEGLLRRLRSVGGLKPWGAIVFSETTQKWGMSWSHETRRAAVAAAQASCASSTSPCAMALTFFGTECGAFGFSESRWSLVARDSTSKARLSALEECQKQGARCKVVATVCADGQDKVTSAQ